MNVAQDKYREEPIVNRQLALCSRSDNLGTRLLGRFIKTKTI